MKIVACIQTTSNTNNELLRAMGKPPTKHSSEGENNSVKYAASSMQGIAAEMEDAHTIILQENGISESFFGVYDGHGGLIFILIRT
uniref:protein-serine/threonine phosphatase n=1 Tax=Aegilops tauschii TaxID=37682 RepID=M8C594_AEGTA